MKKKQKMNGMKSEPSPPPAIEISEAVDSPDSPATYIALPMMALEEEEEDQDEQRDSVQSLGQHPAKMNQVLPLELIKILLDKNKWKKRSLDKRPGGKNSSVNGKQLYARVHQDPRLFRNLYEFLVMSNPGSGGGGDSGDGSGDDGSAPGGGYGKMMQQLDRWEMEIHEEDSTEVLKCLRLHIGDCKLLRKVVCSLKPQEGVAGCCAVANDKLLPFRDSCRNFRKKPTVTQKLQAEKVYDFFKLVYHSLHPFTSAFLIYFEWFKNIWFAYLVYTTLYDMTGGDLFSRSVEFESLLVTTYIAALVLSYVICTYMSVFYSNTITELYLCDHSTSWQKVLAGVVAGVFAPFMPAFLLANQAYYRKKSAEKKRDLQVDVVKPYRDGNRPIKESEMVELFKDVQFYSYRSALHVRIYSYFRAVHAVIDSVLFVTTMVLILVVTGRPERGQKKLVDNISAKICIYLGSAVCSQGSSNAGTDYQLALAKDTAFLASAIFSVLVILTALSRYVFHSKNQNVTFKGQLVLGLYFLCHIVSRLTLFVALFSTAEAVEPGGEEEVPISLLPASIISATLIVIHFGLVWWFKWTFVKEFRKADHIEQFVHVLVNTLVVVSFSRSEIHETQEEKVEKKGYGNGRASGLSSGLVKYTADRDSVDRISVTLSIARLSNRQCIHEMPKMKKEKHYTARKVFRSISALAENEAASKNVLEGDDQLLKELKPLVDEIEEMWWRNPSQKLTKNEVREKLKADAAAAVTAAPISPAKKKVASKKESLSEQAFSENYLDITFEYLESNGLINKRLYWNRPTKIEYFWLLLIHFLMSMFALILEWVNGGRLTTKGVYYSYDVRLGSYFLGIGCLYLYYQRYHVMKDLMTAPACCGYAFVKAFPVLFCCRKDEQLKAIPDREELKRSLCEQDAGAAVAGTKVTMSTQTSLRAPDGLAKDTENGGGANFDQEAVLFAIMSDPSNADKAATAAGDDSCETAAEEEAAAAAAASTAKRRSLPAWKLNFLKPAAAAAAANTKPNRKISTAATNTEHSEAMTNTSFDEL